MQSEELLQPENLFSHHPFKINVNGDLWALSAGGKVQG